MKLHVQAKQQLKQSITDCVNKFLKLLILYTVYIISINGKNIDKKNIYNTVFVLLSIYVGCLFKEYFPYSLLEKFTGLDNFNNESFHK